MQNPNELTQYFQDLEGQDKFSGVVLVTQGHAPLYASAHGYASRAWKIQNTLETRFDTASITKLFTSMAVLQVSNNSWISFGIKQVKTIITLKGSLAYAEQ